MNVSLIRLSERNQLLGIFTIVWLLLGASSVFSDTDTALMDHKERVIGIWISSVPSGAMKYSLTEEGRDEFYVSKIDTAPYYWSEYEIGDMVLDDEGREWLQVIYYAIPPFSESREVLVYSLFSASVDGDELAIEWRAEGPFYPGGVSDAAAIFYRDGTDAADAVADLPSSSEFVGVLHQSPIYLTFYGSSDREKLVEFKESLEEEDVFQILTWEGFVKSIDEIATSFFLFDEYGHETLIPGLVHILRTQGDFEISFTWNTGLAVTNYDYQIASESYSAYIDDPETYEAEMPYMLNYSLNPDVWLSTILGW